MKYILRIPMTDQYSYTEIVCDNIDEYNEAKANYQSFKEVGKPNSGLSPLLFGKVIKKYLITNTVDMEEFQALGSEKVFSQAQVLTIIKNAIASVTRDENGTRAEDNYRK